MLEEGLWDRHQPSSTTIHEMKPAPSEHDAYHEYREGLCSYVSIPMHAGNEANQGCAGRMANYLPSPCSNSGITMRPVASTSEGSSVGATSDRVGKLFVPEPKPARLFTLQCRHRIRCFGVDTIRIVDRGNQSEQPKPDDAQSITFLAV